MVVDRRKKALESMGNSAALAVDYEKDLPCPPPHKNYQYWLFANHELIVVSFQYRQPSSISSASSVACKVLAHLDLIFILVVAFPTRIVEDWLLQQLLS